MTRRARTLATAGGVLLLLATGPATAGGFQVFQQGAKASGRGGAFTAGADDASATYYNPAAAASMEGWSLYLGMSGLRQDTIYDPPVGEPTSMQDVATYPANVYLVGRLGENYALALGAWVPYSVKTHWWATDPLARSSLKASWTSRLYNANVVARLGPAWSMSVGAEVARLKIDDLSSVRGFFGTQWNIVADGTKAGANLAFHYRQVDGRMRFGLSFRSQKIVKMEGAIRVEDDSGGPPLSETPIRVNVTLPATLQVGIGEEGRGRWDWEIDLQYAKWSKFERLEFVGSNFQETQLEEWVDTFTLFAGFDYHFNEHHSGRGGLIFDPTPIPEERARPYNPDADKAGLTAGYGFRRGRYSVDAYAQVFVYKAMSPTGGLGGGVVAGTYDTRAYAAGLSFQYRF